MPSFLSKIFRRKGGSGNGGEKKSKKDKKKLKKEKHGKHAQTDFPSKEGNDDSSPLQTSGLNVEIPTHHGKGVVPMVDPSETKVDPVVRHTIVNLDNNTSFDDGRGNKPNDENCDSSNGNVVAQFAPDFEQSESPSRRSRPNRQPYKNYQLTDADKAHHATTTSPGSSPTKCPQLTNKWLQQHQQMQQTREGKERMLMKRSGSGRLIPVDAYGQPTSQPHSPTSSSDFCLSTDQEDEEYNLLKAQSSLLTGNEPGSPNSQSTEEYVLFPGLSADAEDDDEEQESGDFQIEPMANETEEAFRAWTPSPPRLAPITASSPHVGNSQASPRFSFEGDDGANQAKKKVTKLPSLAPAPAPAPVQPTRPLTQPRVHPPPSQYPDTVTVRKDGPDLYPDSTDSEFESPALAGESLLVSSGSIDSPKLGAPIDHTANALGERLSNASASPCSLHTPTDDPWPQDDKLKESRAPLVIATRSFSPDNRRATDRGPSPVTSTTSSPNRAAVTPSPSPESERALRHRTTQRDHHFSEPGESHILSPARVPSSPSRAQKEKLKRKKRRKEKESSPLNSQRHPTSGGSGSDSPSDPESSWLFDEVTDTLGPRGIAADMESLSGRSARSNRSKTSTGAKSHRSTKSHRSARSHKSNRRTRRNVSSASSVGSRNSHVSHRSTRSQLSHMSDASRSVANDLLRLEMQLAMVGSEKEIATGVGGGSSVGGNSRASYGSERYYGSQSIGGGNYGSQSVGGTCRANRNRERKSRSHPSGSSVRRNRLNIVAPPGKLGIILANKFDSKGTVISGVRSSSVLADKIFPGDRIVAIDGEDVSRMTVSEITTIMARKNEFERTLTVLTTPKSSSSGGGGMTSPQSAVENMEYVGGVSDNGSLVSSTLSSSYVNYRR